MEPSLSFARYPSLENAVVFVTGGASGIGEYMVRAFAEQGARTGFVDIATTMLIFALFASGFNLLFGHVGELSFGHAMFFALGAYTTALYTKGFSVALFGHQFQHAPTDGMIVALAIAVVLCAALLAGSVPIGFRKIYVSWPPRLLRNAWADMQD